MGLSKQAKILLIEFGKCEIRYGASIYGIFIDRHSNHDFVVKQGHKLKEYKFNRLSSEEILFALKELNNKYLNFSINMHYYIQLTDKGRKVSKKMYIDRKRERQNLKDCPHGIKQITTMQD